MGIGSILASLVEWQNILFTTTFGLGALLFAVQAMGLVGHHDGHAEGHAHGHADGHAEGHAHHDHDHDHEHEAGFGKAFGLGKVPLALLLPLALTSFGFIGLAINLFLGSLAASALVFGTLAASAAGSLLVLRGTSGAFAKLLGDGVQSVASKQDLYGQIGVVKSGKVDREFGLVKVKDPFGNDHEVAAVTIDEGAEVPYGQEVVIVDWDASKNRYRVALFGSKQGENSPS